MRLLFALRCGDAMRSAVCAVAVLLLTARSASAEALFHLRDLHDQPNRPALPRTISSKEEAKTYLEKYGYLNCSGGRSRRELPIAREGSDNRGSVNCTDEEIQQALRRLQRHLSLAESGELDDTTKQRMSMERCGNKDKDPPGDVHSDSRVAKQLPRVADDGQRQSSLYMHEAGDSDSQPPVSSPASSRHRSRRSVPSSRGGEARSLLARIHSPIITEGQSTTPHRRTSDEEIWKKARTERIRSKLKRKLGKSNVFLDLIENYKKERARRKKRSAIGDRGQQFNADTRDITWEFPEEFLSGTLPEVDQKALVSRAFRMWSEVSPVIFKEQSLPDITVAFGKERHMGCLKVFDGKGGEVAHSWAAGDIHFDQDENYRWDSASHGVNFGRVAMHEIGHVLGLEHTENTNSVMYPVLVDAGTDSFELPVDDRQYIQDLYGQCKGSFDIVIDWLRLEQPIDMTNPRYVFNTYFFRGNHYWMYENRYSRTRYGDPLHTVVHWNGLPEHMDAYTQVRQPTATPYLFHVETLFFQGPDVYLYDDVNDRVADGYPKLISQEFGPKNSNWEPIPENLDAVFFHMDSNMIYFFKNKWVWRYPGSTQGVDPGGCCEEKMLFTDMFPVQEVSGARLDGYVDTVYYSFQRVTTYLFKGEEVYEMIPDGARWRLVQLGPWYDYWFDICDVE